MLHWTPDTPSNEEACLRALNALDLRSEPPDQALEALAELRNVEDCGNPGPYVAASLERPSAPTDTVYGTLPISVTIGYGQFERERDLTLREFVHRIDRALYDAKRDVGAARSCIRYGRRLSDRQQ